jgi:hypothetical protein
METDKAREIKYSKDFENELEDFTKQTTKSLNDNLQRIINDIASTGLTCYPWEFLKQLIGYRLEQILDEWQAKSPLPDFEQQKKKLLDALSGFSGVPFTVQRMCELLVRPTLYSSTKKFIFAYDKLLSVSTTQETLSATDYDTQVAQQHKAINAIKQSDKQFDEPVAEKKDDSEDEGGSIEDKKEEGASSNEQVDPPTPMDIEKTSE